MSILLELIEEVQDHALTADDLESIVRSGHIGDAPAEPVRIPRPTDSLDPTDVENDATARSVALAMDLGGNTAAYKVGTYQGHYRRLYREYSAVVAELGRLRAEAFAFFPDEAHAGSYNS
jgi:hypothetical protein